MKTGAGTQTLRMGSYYGGGTTISGGTLNVINTIDSATGFGAVTVGVLGTLAGTGFIDSGTNLVNIGGALVVGDSTLGVPVASELRFVNTGAGSVITGAASLWNFDLFIRGGDLTANAAAADRVKLFGDLDGTFGGTLVLGNPASLSGWAAGDKWTLFNLVSGPGGTITGNFSSIDTTSLALPGSLYASFDPSNGVLSLLGVPEPSRMMLLGFGLFGLALRRRRA